MSEDDTTRFSRRKLLGSVATIGAAGAIGGASTTALLWDEEVFGNESNPNVLQAGELDLKTSYDVNYYDWIGNDPEELTTDGNQIDQPTDNGYVFTLDDIKPGDVVEKTIGLHLYGNPGFLYTNGEIFTDMDGGDMPEPEDKVNSHTPDDADGTGDGDLDDHMQVLVWLDGYEREVDGTTVASTGAGNNFPNEVLTGDATGYVDETGDPTNIDDFLMALTGVGNPAEQGYVDPSDPQFVFHGTLRDFISGADTDHAQGNYGSPITPTVGPAGPASWPGIEDDGLLLSGAGYEAGGDLLAGDFQSDYCFTNSTTAYLGILMWLPIDVPGVNDNIIQTDTVEYGFAFNAIQCRHNVGNNGMPVSRTLDQADAENNAQGVNNSSS